MLNSARVSSSTGKSLLSISIAVTLSARLASSAVKTPTPVPISSIPKPSRAFPYSAILGHISGLMMKFCPRPFEKLNP